MLILGAGELQIRPNGGRREESRLYSVDGQQIRTDGWWLVYFIPNKRIGNADTRCGRIANSPERVCPDGSALAVVGGRREESRLYSVDGQQIRLNGWWMVYF